MFPSRFVRRPRPAAPRPALVGVNGPRLFVESLEDRVTPAFSPNPLFTQATLPGTGSPTNQNGAPTSIVVGDFNGDGREDFAGLADTGAGLNAAARINVYLSTGATGSTYTVVNIQPGSGFVGGTLTERKFAPASLAAIDVTSDGKAELAAVSQTTGELIVYQLNNGNASFSEIASTQFDFALNSGVPDPTKPNLSVGGVAGGDFNNDGKGDFVVTLTGSPNGNQYFFFYNNGNGKSYTPIATPRATGTGVGDYLKPIVADFDGDGNDDVAFLHPSNKQVFVLFGDGAAGVSFVRSLGLSATPTAITTGDFDHNGRTDIAVGLADGTVTVFLKDSAGTSFTTKANAIALDTGAPILGLAAGDFNVDTYDDLAVVTGRATDPVTNQTSAADFSVYLGSKDIRTTKLVQAAGSPYGPLTAPGGSVATVDLDNNGNPDIVVGEGTSSGQLYVAFNNKSGVGGETFLTESTTSTQFGLPVTYNVTVYPPPLGGTLPSGTVTFFDVVTGGSGAQTFINLGTAGLSAGLDGEGSSVSKAKFSYDQFSVGQHTVVGKYSGDTNYAGQTSNAVTVTVAQAGTSTTLTTPVSSPVFGQPVPLVATVKSGAGSVAGSSVSFFESNNLIGNATVDTNGQATITVSDFSLGDHSLSAQFQGTTDNAISTSPTLVVTVGKANSNTTLAASKSAATFGDSITLSSTVSIAAPGVGAPTGNVKFFDGQTLLGTGVVNVNSGQASIQTTALSVGPHALTAQFSGNTGVAGSTSPAASVTIAPTASKATLAVLPTTNQIGTPVTLTATVTDVQGRPVTVGSVTFSGTNGSGQAVLRGPFAVGSDGTASAVVRNLPLGTSTFTAQFSGTDSITGAATNAVTVSTVRAVPVVTLTNSTGKQTAVLGKDVTFTAAYAPSAGLSAPVTGTVTFLDGTTSLGTVTITNGTAAITSRLKLGTHTITSQYSGDGNYSETSTPQQFLITNAIDSITVGAGAGGTDIVRIYNPDGSQTKNPLFAFGPDNTSGARVASGDLNGDGVPDFVIGTGPGTQARVRAFDGATFAPLFDTFPFENFTGGVYVAVGDVNGDLRGDIVVTPDQGGGPRVTIYDGATFNVINNFFGIDDPNFRGGARAAVGDLNNDGANDVVVSAGFGGGPRIAAYDGRSLRTNTPVKLFNDFFAFEDTLRNGTFVSVGDVNGDGYGDIVLGAGPGGGPRVIAVSGFNLVTSGGAVQNLVANFFAGDVNARGGVPVAVRQLDGDPLADIVTGSGPGSRQVNAYLGSTITPSNQPPASQSFNAFDDNFNPQGGVFVG